MKKIFSTILLVALTTLPFTGNASPYLDLFHEMGVIKDSATIPFSADLELANQRSPFPKTEEGRIAGTATPTALILAKIVPSKESGRIEKVIDNVVRKDGSTKVNLILDGKFETQSELIGKPEKKDWQYRVERRGFSKNGVGSFSSGIQYPALETEGYCISLVSKLGDKDEQVVANWILPTGWEKFVTPAFNFYQANPQIFARDIRGVNYKSLVDLISDDNPLLSIAAIQSLKNQGMFDVVDARTLTKKNDLRLPVIVYHLIMPSEEENLEESIGKVKTIVRKAGSRTDLLKIGLGLYTAVTERSDKNESDIKLSAAIFTDIKSRQEQLPADADADSLLSALYWYSDLLS